MPCLACAALPGSPLCGECADSMAPAPVRRVGDVLVSSAFRHEGAARRLVHRLKYGGLPAAAEPLANSMVPLLPASAEWLVPVPRVVARRWRYGIDPTDEITRRLSRHSGLPVAAVLRAPPWWARRAGSVARVRGTPTFRASTHRIRGVVLVDDVLTTGATLMAAAAALPGTHHGLTATAAVTPAMSPDH